MRHGGGEVRPPKWKPDESGEWEDYVTSRGNVARRPRMVLASDGGAAVVENGAKDVIELWLRQGGFCGICWLPLHPRVADANDPEAATIDHVVPRAHGGADGLANVQAAHRGCNSAKGARPASATWLHDDFPGRQDVASPRVAFAPEFMAQVRRDWLRRRRAVRGRRARVLGDW